MPSTDEYLEFAGVSLHEFGWSVATVAGGRYGVPPLRGDNQTAAFVPGELWVPKVPGPRTVTLSMWVTGADPGTGDAVDDPRLRWNDNWAYLREVFWNPDAEGLLRRRWWRTDAVTGAGGIVTADALAQLEPGQDIALRMSTRTRAEFEVPLRLAHPFFYGPAVSVDVLGGQTVSVGNVGDTAAWSKYLYLDFVGPLSNPRLFNTTAGVSCGVTGSVGAGETVTLDVRQFLALSSRTTTTTKTNRTGDVYNSGTRRAWMALLRGVNALTLNAGGSGKVTVRFRPPYL